MVPVLQCLTTLRASFSFYDEEDSTQDHMRKRWNFADDHSQGRLTTSWRDSAIAGQEVKWDSLGPEFQQNLHDSLTEGILILFSCTIFLLENIFYSISKLSKFLE